MGIKDKFENHPVVFGIGLLIVGFIAGFGAYKAISDMTSPKSTLEPPPSETNWQEIARKADWAPKSECPAYPVTINLTSPGNGSVVDISGSTIYTDLVLQASRPISDNTVLGIVVNQIKQPNFYVIFPTLNSNSEKKIFRSNAYFSVQFNPEINNNLNMWAILVDDKTKFGSVYSSIEQIKASSSDVVFSPLVTLTTKEKKY